MKNGHLPLIQALRSRTKKPEGESMPFSEPQRLFQLNKEDIHPQADPDPGDNAKFVIHGKIKSVHDDGSMMMHVQKVEHQLNGGESDVADAKPDIVTTQESHTP